MARPPDEVPILSRWYQLRGPVTFATARSSAFAVAAVTRPLGLRPERR
jgi:hypothetical protein